MITGHADQWRLAPAIGWLDEVTLAGGTPYRVTTLTERGAGLVREVLSGSSQTPAGAAHELLSRLQFAGLLLSPAPAPAAAISVTVVIPARSAAEPMVALLNRMPTDVEVIVVDDGSEPALHHLADGRPNVTVLRHPTSRGPGAARNTGAARVHTTWIAFLDADTEPDPQWILNLKGWMDQADQLAPPGVGQVVLAAPKIYALCRPGWAGWFERRICALDLGDAPSDVGIGMAVSYVPSAALLVNRDAFVQVGGFDESMQVGEDVDLVWRLAPLGRLRYVPAVRVGHEPRRSIWAALRRRSDYGYSAAELGRRYPGALRHVDVPIRSLGPWLIGLFIHPLAGLAAAALTVAVAPQAMPAISPSRSRQLTARGHLIASGALGRWLIRPMVPATVVIGVISPVVGRRLAAAAIGGLVYLSILEVRTGTATTGWWATARSAAESIVARTLDDVFYSVGVWKGVVTLKTLEPVLPRIRAVSFRRLYGARRATRA